MCTKCIFAILEHNQNVMWFFSVIRKASLYSDIVNTLGSIANTIGRDIVIDEMRKRIFMLTSYNFCISTPILKFKAVI